MATYHSDIVRQRLTGAVYRPLQQRFLARARLIMPTSRHYMESSAALRDHRPAPHNDRTHRDFAAQTGSAGLVESDGHKIDHSAIR